MRELIRKNIGVIVFAVLVHAALLGLLVSSFDWQSEKKTLVAQPNIVKAVVVDASKVQAELDKLKRADERKKKNEKDRLAKLKKEEKKLRKKRTAEEKRLAKLKKKRIAEEKQRKAEEKQRKAEEKKLATLKKQQADLKKKRQADDKKRTAEKVRQAKLKKQQDAEKKKQDAIKKKLALAKKKREADKRQRQKELDDGLAAEEKTREDKLAKSERDKYQVLIRQKIERNWLKPPGDLKGLLSVVTIRLIPSGDVIDANIMRTSGNLVYDRSVERAALKASPLPLPKNATIAAQLYNINLEFRAE